jgi:acyl-CoA thioesterase
LRLTAEVAAEEQRGAKRSAFDADTAIERVDESMFAATVSDRWNRILGGPLGGYLTAICLRALTEVTTLPDPIVISAFFLRPGEVGPAEVHAELVRAGRRTATAQGGLVQSGKERVRLLATFADLHRRSGRTAILDAPPDLPPPETCVDPLKDMPIGASTIAERVELRTAERPGWLRGKPTGRPAGEFWIRLTDGGNGDLASLALLVDAIPLAVLELGEPGSTTLELTVHLRAHPAAGWLVARNKTHHMIDGLHEEDVEIWDSTGKLVAQSRQLAMLPGDG